MWRVAEDRPAPDVAVVRDVHVCHEQVVIADRRLAATTSVPRLIVTNSRKTLRPIRSAVDSPLYFRSCGASPIEAIGNIWVSSRCGFDHR